MTLPLRVGHDRDYVPEVRDENDAETCVTGGAFRAGAPWRPSLRAMNSMTFVVWFDLGRLAWITTLRFRSPRRAPANGAAPPIDLASSAAAAVVPYTTTGAAAPPARTDTPDPLPATDVHAAPVLSSA